MTPSPNPQHDALAMHLDSVKELYAEFFLLLDQSVRRQAEPLISDTLDIALDQLMLSIERRMKVYQTSLRDARGPRGLPPDLCAQALEFDEKLRGALETMVDRVRGRQDELARQRDEIKHSLQKIQQKKRGAQGYHGPRTQPTCNLIESEI